jgi:hypothetical protein
MTKVYREGCTPQVSGAYVDGIIEGRQFLKANPWMTAVDKQRCMENAAENMRRHSGLMRDAFKGERDFWRNQLKGSR